MPTPKYSPGQRVRLRAHAETNIPEEEGEIVEVMTAPTIEMLVQYAEQFANVAWHTHTFYVVKVAAKAGDSGLREGVPERDIVEEV